MVRRFLRSSFRALTRSSAVVMPSLLTRARSWSSRAVVAATPTSALIRASSSSSQVSSSILVRVRTDADESPEQGPGLAQPVTEAGPGGLLGDFGFRLGLGLRRRLAAAAAAAASAWAAASRASASATTSAAWRASSSSLGIFRRLALGAGAAGGFRVPRPDPEPLDPLTRLDGGGSSSDPLPLGRAETNARVIAATPRTTRTPNRIHMSGSNVGLPGDL